MKKSEMNLIMVGLGAAYPRAFPQTEAELQAVAIVWYADLGHLDAVLVDKAAANMRKRCEWPSIAELWRSVLTLAGMPDYYTVKQEIAVHREGGLADLSMLTKRVYDAYGDAWDHRHADGRFYDQSLRKCYDEAVEWYGNGMMDAANVGLLMEQYNKKQLRETTNG